jgi:hypothetical protein
MAGTTSLFMLDTGSDFTVCGRVTPEQERDPLAAELATLERASTKPAKAPDRDAEVEAIGRAWTLADDLQKADPVHLREPFNRLLASIEHITGSFFGAFPNV